MKKLLVGLTITIAASALGIGAAAFFTMATNNENTSEDSNAQWPAGVPEPPPYVEPPDPPEHIAKANSEKVDQEIERSKHKKPSKKLIAILGSDNEELHNRTIGFLTAWRTAVEQKPHDKQHREEMTMLISEALLGTLDGEADVKLQKIEKLFKLERHELLEPK